MIPVATHVWQSTLFAGVVALATLSFRRNRAQVRYGLWLAALADGAGVGAARWH